MTPTPNPEPSQIISVPSLVDSVARELRKLITSGTLEPGERLIEERLAEQFGVSRPPLREALRMLQNEGLVHRIPRRGVVVTTLNADDAEEIYTLRWALERLAVDLGVPVRDPARLIPLRHALDLIRVSAEANDGEGLLDANVEFHRALCALPGHRRLLRTYDSVMREMRMYMALNLRTRATLGGPDDPVRRHQVLFDLIEAGDVDGVHREIEHHGDRQFMRELQERRRSAAADLRDQNSRHDIDTQRDAGGLVTDGAGPSDE